MAASMNKVILVGRLGQDPKLSYTQSGQAVANFSMATDEGYKDRNTGQRVDKTEWHKVVCWRQTAEFVGNYLTKGRLVLVEGKLQTRKWQDQQGQDRYSTEIVASNVSFLDSQNNQQGHGQPPQGGYQQSPQQQGSGTPPRTGHYPAVSQQQDEDLGPAFPSEASSMDDVPF